MPPPSLPTARAVAVMLAVTIVLTDVAGIRQLFMWEAYLGVGLLLAIGMALAVAASLLVSAGPGVWAFGLVIGALNALGAAVSAVLGLPLLTPAETADPLFRASVVTLGAEGLLLAGLAGWVLGAHYIWPTAGRESAVARANGRLDRPAGRAADPGTGKQAAAPAVPAEGPARVAAPAEPMPVPEPRRRAPSRGRERTGGHE